MQVGPGGNVVRPNSKGLTYVSLELLVLEGGITMDERQNHQRRDTHSLSSRKAIIQTNKIVVKKEYLGRKKYLS